jgi:hypothetical protein
VILKTLLGGLIGLLLVGAFADPSRAFVSPLQDRPAPEFPDTTWINSSPLKLQELRGRVVLLEFWTYG